MAAREARQEGGLDDAADLLITASRALLAISVRSVLNASVDLTVAQHRVLLILATHGPLAVNQVAAHLGVDQSNAGRHCQRLQRSGLVDRVRSEADRRSLEVVITEAGTRVLAEVTADRRRHISAVLEQMAPAEVDAVVQSLTAFNQAAGVLEPQVP